MTQVQDRLRDLLGRVVGEARQSQDPAVALALIMEAIRALTDAADRLCRSDPNRIVRSASTPSPNSQALDGQSLDEIDNFAPVLVYKARRLRDRVFNDPTLFGEPAWDILLDALVSEQSDRPISITSACTAASVPPTTALRWISLLQQKELLTRANDAADKRRSFVRLTAHGTRKMHAYFSRLAELRAERSRRTRAHSRPAS